MKTYRRQRNIKTKLMGAICMLLISSLMMVSTTYAWFTLSTAPEVTGITTAVGANGNLEMALLPENGQEGSIKTDVGDGVKETKEKNITWGNLVDLSDSSIYGLDKISVEDSTETDFSTVGELTVEQRNINKCNMLSCTQGFCQPSNLECALYI